MNINGLSRFLDDEIPVRSHTALGNLPNEIVVLVLKYLDAKNLNKCCQISTLWCRIVNDQPVSGLSTFTPETWKEYFKYQVKKVPSLPCRLNQMIRSVFVCFFGENESPHSTLLFMPKGLTLKKLMKMMKKPVKGEEVKIEGVKNEVIKEIGNVKLKQSYWLWVTDDVISGSGNMTYEQHRDFIVSKSRSYCELPAVLEMLACCVMHYVTSEKRLFGNYSYTYTRCKDLVDQQPLAIGSFNIDGVNILCGKYTFDCIGAVISRRFELY